MFIDKKITVTSIAVYEYDFYKNKTHVVGARPFHSLSFRIEGKASFEIGESSFVSEAGSITYVPKGVAYKTEILESGKMYCVHFTIAEEYENLLPRRIAPTNSVDFLNLYSELAARFRLGRENDLHCMSIFYEILSRARHEHRKKHSALLNPRVKKAKERVDKDFSDPELSVALLAKEAQVSEVYFRREFSASVGISPSAYIKKVRIENAKAYLRTGLFSVTEVAVKCGFDSISYFSHEFHRSSGMTPREYAGRFG